MAKKIGLLMVLVVLVFGVGYRVMAAPASSDAVRVAALVQEMEGVTPAKLEEMSAVDVKPYTLPGASVDVMRVRLEESYTIDGIGKDDVELTGWIAVRHGASRPAPGARSLSTRAAPGWTKNS